MQFVVAITYWVKFLEVKIIRQRMVFQICRCICDGMTSTLEQSFLANRNSRLSKYAPCKSSIRYSPLLLLNRHLHLVSQVDIIIIDITLNATHDNRARAVGVGERWSGGYPFTVDIGIRATDAEVLLATAVPIARNSGYLAPFEDLGSDRAFEFRP